MGVSTRAVFLVLPLAACARTSEPDSELPEAEPAPLIDTSEYTGPAEEPPDAASSEPRPESVIYRSELARATANGKAGYLLSQLGPEPHRPRGRWEGWRITTVFPSDPGICAPGCDLYPGDVILTVNGSPLERPEQLSELMAKLGEMETLSVRLIRNGELHSREFQVIEG
jgi:S1-C subfamily serine protease